MNPLITQTCCGGTCNASLDAEKIHLALKGIANDERALLEIVGRRSNSHLQRVREEYEKLYGHDMLNKVKSDVKSVYKRIISALIKSHPEYRAKLIHRSLKKNERCESEPFVNFIVAQDNRELEETKHYFRTRFNLPMVDFIKTFTKGELKGLLLRCVEARRSVGIEEDKIERDLLLLSGEKINFASDEMLDIFAYRSHEHLLKLVQLYHQKNNVPLESVIVNETKSYFSSSLMACIEPKNIFWAKRMFQAFRDLQKSDCLLTCCFTQLEKPFLQNVAQQYQNLFNVPLVEEIQKYTSGSYRDLLMTLMNYPENEMNQYQSFVPLI